MPKENATIRKEVEAKRKEDIMIARFLIVILRMSLILYEMLG